MKKKNNADKVADLSVYREKKKKIKESPPNKKKTNYRVTTGQQLSKRNIKQSVPKTKKSKKIRIRRKRTSAMRKQAYGFFSLLLVFLLCISGSFLFKLYRESEITEAKYQLNQLQMEHENIINRSKELQVELEQKSTSSYIEDQARLLEMDYPRPDQIIYIDINQ